MFSLRLENKFQVTSVVVVEGLKLLDGCLLEFVKIVRVALLLMKLP